MLAMSCSRSEMTLTILAYLASGNYTACDRTYRGDQSRIRAERFLGFLVPDLGKHRPLPKVPVRSIRTG